MALTAVHTIASLARAAGGPVYTVSRLCDSLAHAGANVQLVSLASPEGEREAVLPASHGVKVHLAKPAVFAARRSAYGAGFHRAIREACREGRPVMLQGGRSPLLAAGYEGPREEASLVLPPDSTLVLYTDGLVERRDEPFHLGIDRLRETVEAANEFEPAALVETLVDALLGDRDRTDDTALLVLRTGDPIPFAVRLADTPEELRPMRHRLRAWLDLRGCAPDDTDAVVLAVNEAAANAIEHGYLDGDGPVVITGDVIDGRLRICVEDNGEWRDTDPDPARGRGLALMRTLMDDVDIEPLHPGTRIVLRRAVGASAGAPAMAGYDARG